MSLVARIREMLQSDRPHAATLLERDARDQLPSGDVLVTPAAVLIPLVDRPEPGVILTIRTSTVRRHAGQVAFPGGRIDPGDADSIAAALREAEEEIGLAPDKVEILGVADRYHTVTGFDVTPVVGLLPPSLAFTLQPDEVAAVFEVPLAHLLEPAHHIYRDVLWQGRQRSYYEIEWEGRRIWGATAAMIVNLSRRLAAAA